MKRIFSSLGSTAAVVAPAPALAVAGQPHGTGMMWGMGGMWILWILIVVVLVLGILALVKYLR